MVVVSPFVAGQKEGNNFTQGISIIQSLSDVTFIQNQAITRGTSLAGGALVAYGSKPRTSGYISHLHNPTAADKALKTGKGFAPNTRHGLKFTKPYSGIGRSGVSGPATPRHGHYTQDHTSKAGVTKTARRRSPRAIGVGRAIPILGYGLVAHNLLFDPKKANEVQKETGFFGLPTHPDDWVISRDVISNSFSTLATKPKSLSGAVLVTRRFYPGGLF